MKPHLISAHTVSRAALLATSFGLAVASHANDIIKLDNITALNDGASWNGGTAPGTSDVAVWDSTVTAANAAALGADLSWSGIKLGSPGGAVTINAGNTLTLGSAGIDMSSATQDLTLANAVTLGAGQSWNVALDHILTANGALGGTGPLTKSGAGTLALGATNYGGVLTVSQGRLQLNNATSLQTTASLVIGDGNSGDTVPTVFFNNSTPTFTAITVGGGVTDARILSNSWAQNVTGNTTLNSPVKIIRTTGGGVHGGFQNSGIVTGNGGGSGNDSLIFEHGGGGNFYWQAGNTAANDFAGNIHIMGAGSMNAQGGSNGPNNVVIPDTAMVTIDAGSSFIWNNFGNNAVVETFDGLAGGGTMNRNTGGGLVPGLTLTINANNADNEGDRVFTGSLSGLTTPLTLGGAGTQEFSGSGVAYGTATNLNNGTLKLTNTSAWASSIAIGTSNAPVVQLNSALETDAWNFTKQISGANNSAIVRKTGPGAVTLTSAQTYTGGTQVNEGKLMLSSGTALPTGFPSIPGMKVWLDAADPEGDGDTTVPADASPVATWKNKGSLGSSGDFTATGSGANNPVFTANGGGFNGKPTITFDDAGKQLVNATNFTNTLSVVYVGRIGATKQRLVSGNTINWILGYWNNQMNANYWGGGSLGGTADTSAHVWIGGATGGSYASFRFDGAGEASIGTGSGAAPTAGLMLGGGWAGGENSDGEIAELFVFDHQLTTLERQQLEGYLHNKYFGSQFGVVSIASTSPVSVANGGTFGGNGTAGNVAVANGGTLEGSYNGTGTLTANAVTLGTSAADSVTLKGTISAGGKPIKVSSLTINGGNQKVQLNATGAGLTNGTTYDLLESDTVITAPNATNVLSSLKSSSRSYTPMVDGTGKKIQLFFDANASIYWTGTGSNVWGTGINNWKLSGNNATTQFLPNDAVFFHDSPAANTVDIANANVTPLSTTFDNTTATEYTITSPGEFGISTGSITKNNSGSVIFTNHNPTTGAVTLNGGNATLWFEDSLGTGPITFGGGKLTYDGAGTTWTRNFTLNAGGGTVDVTGNAGTLAQTGTVSGSGSLTKTGLGTLALGGNNETWTTGFTVSQGTLQMATGGSNAFGSGPITLGDANSGTEELALSFQGLGNNITTGPITVANQGGGTSIRGTLNPVGANSTPAVPTLTLNKQVTLRAAEGAPSGRASDLSFAKITGSGAGAGNDSVVIEGNGAIVRTSVTDAGTAYDFTGNVRVANGTWQMQNRAYLGYTAEHSNLIVPDTASVTVDAGATWGITHTLSETIAGLNGAGIVQNRFSSQLTTLVVGSDNANGDFSGVVQGGSSGLALKKIGNGTQVLSGENTYGGGTVVEGGTLVLNNSTGSGAGSGAVTVQTGAILTGSGSASGATTIAAGATVAPGNGVGTLSLGSGTLAGTYQCQLNGASADLLNVTGALTVDPTATINVSTLGALTEASYTILSYGSLVGSAPAVTGVPDGFHVDTSVPGQLRLSQGGDPYTNWIDGFGLTNASDKTPTADPDKDGLANIIEFVLDGNPNSGTITNLPTLSVSGANMVFTYTRRDDAESFNPTVEFNSGLTGTWTTAVHGTNCTIVVSENGAAPDTVTVTIPKGTNQKLFARLKVTP